MSWPVGFVNREHTLASLPDGTVCVDGAAITESNGWLEVPVPSSLRWTGGPDSFTVRVRISPDETGRLGFHAEQAELGTRRYSGLYALARDRGGEWLEPAVHAIRQALLEKIASSRAPRAINRSGTFASAGTAAAANESEDTWAELLG